jgi:hypothetical protein
MIVPPCLILNTGHIRSQDNYLVLYPVWQHKKAWALLLFSGEDESIQNSRQELLGFLYLTIWNNSYIS